jgi:hypothetical protein
VPTVQVDEARVIAAAEKDGVEPHRIRRVLCMSERTYFRRKALAERLRARRERGEE